MKKQQNKTPKGPKPPFPAQNSNGLPKVTNIPPMPKVKDPKTEGGMECTCGTPKDQTGANGPVLQCGICYGGYSVKPAPLPRKKVSFSESLLQPAKDAKKARLEAMDSSPLPRKEVIVESCNDCFLNRQASCGYDLDVSPEEVGFYREHIDGFPDNCPLKEGSFGIGRQTNIQAVKDAFIPIIPPMPRKEVISIQPGDVVVVKYKEDLTPADTENLSKGVQGLFPNNKSIVLGGGASLEVYRERGKETKSLCGNCPECPCNGDFTKCEHKDYLEGLEKQRLEMQREQVKDDEPPKAPENRETNSMGV